MSLGQSFTEARVARRSLTLLGFARLSGLLGLSGFTRLLGLLAARFGGGSTCRGGSVLLPFTLTLACRLHGLAQRGVIALLLNALHEFKPFLSHLYAIARLKSKMSGLCSKTSFKRRNKRFIYFNIRSI